MLKWWAFFFMRGMAVMGPYDTQEECARELAAKIAEPIMDRGFDNARSDGLCLQAIRPERAHQ